MNFAPGRLTFAAATLAAGLWSAAAGATVYTTAPTVSYDLDNQTLTVTPTGPTTIVVGSGASFSVAGSWSSNFNGGGGCYSCYIQTYLAGLSPLSGQIDLFDPASQGSYPGSYYSSGSGTYSDTFTAPETAGTYYIGGAGLANYGFVSGVVGGPNGSDQVSYIIKDVPEPASLILLGSGMVALGAIRRHRRAAKI